MSINKGSYDDMSIRSSIDLKDRDKNNDIAVQVQYFLFHLLACNLISLTIVLCKLWNEIFGGLVFGFLESYSFLHICKISLLVCLPLGLLYLRTFSKIAITVFLEPFPFTFPVTISSAF